MLRRVALVRTDDTEELCASFIMVTRISKLGTTLAASRASKDATFNDNALALNGRLVSSRAPDRVVSGTIKDVWKESKSSVFMVCQVGESRIIEPGYSNQTPGNTKEGRDPVGFIEHGAVKSFRYL
jgi:hypothetical protein